MGEVRVEVSPTNKNFTELEQVKIDHLRYQIPTTTYTILTYQALTYPVGHFEITLRLMTRFEDDPEEIVLEKYVLTDVEITLPNYMRKTTVRNWGEEWVDLGPDHEKKASYAFVNLTTCQQVVSELVSMLGMQPCDGSDKIQMEEKTHYLLLFGVWIPDIPVMAHVRMRRKPKTGVWIEIRVRSKDPYLNKMLATIADVSLVRAL